MGKPLVAAWASSDSFSFIISHKIGCNGRKRKVGKMGSCSIWPYNFDVSSLSVNAKYSNSRFMIFLRLLLRNASNLLEMHNKITDELEKSVQYFMEKIDQITNISVQRRSVGRDVVMNYLEMETLAYIGLFFFFVQKIKIFFFKVNQQKCLF